ncbi:hypothetical protein ACFVMC_22545 [Nocardia sp. NPDC127579]|uniref:hypothetical protein n=1 Tax=Nocardia sp. NPDC127579 TaxID=3345402 RepID=UPI00362EB9EF
MTDKTYLVDITTAAGRSGDRDTIGGWPMLDPGQQWPECGCGTRMALHFQLEIPADIPYFGGDQLLVFYCPRESDISYSAESQLPERYWDQPPGSDSVFWRILLQRNGAPHPEADPYFLPRRLALRSADRDIVADPGGVPQAFTIGGAPVWLQRAEHYRCACGADLAFLGQIDEGFTFSEFARPELEDDEDGFEGLDDGLFLGNEVYLFACPAHCNPAATWVACQN